MPNNKKLVGFDNKGLDVSDSIHSSEEETKRIQQFSPVSLESGYRSHKSSEDPNHTPELNGNYKHNNNSSSWNPGVLVFNCRESLNKSITRRRNTLAVLVKLLLVIGVNVYLGGAVWYRVSNSDTLDPINFCHDFGFLTVLTGFVYFCVFYFFAVKPFCRNSSCAKAIGKQISRILRVRTVRIIAVATMLMGFGAFLILDAWDNPSRLISVLGLAVLVLLGFIFSKHPDKIIWRQVIMGLALQFIMALIVLRWETGKAIFQCLGDKISDFLAFTDAGSGFVYGYLVSEKINDTLKLPAIFAFKALSVIFFFSFFIQILYYYGAMQWIVSKMGWLLEVSIGTTACESMSAAANIFLGTTESPLLIKPYLGIMTKSEIHAVITGGFASIAGSVMAAYISMGISAAHLLTASVMSAPAALAYSKLFYPESEKSKTTSKHIKEFKIEESEQSNVLEAATNGASSAIYLVANIIANLIAFLAMITMLNSVCAWFGGLVGAPYLSFEHMMGKLFIPLAWLMGVDAEECESVAIVIGLKTIVNEFVGYQRLAEMTKAGLLSPRGATIATYALCGFSNPASIGVAIGGMSAMAPEKKPVLVEVAFRAFIAGCAACFLTACVAGALTTEPGRDSWTPPPNTQNITFTKFF